MQAATNQFENIVKQAPVGIIILRGRDMIVEMANETYQQIVDRTEAELVGHSLYEVLPEVKEFVEPLLNNVYNTGEPYYGFEFPVNLNRYGQQSRTYFNFVYQALRDAAGAISGIIVVANEVTTLVQTRQSIEESEKQFRNLVMDSPIAMTVLRGPDFIIERANHTLLSNIWHKKEADVLGKKILDLFPELNQQKYPALLNKVLTTGVLHREADSLAIVGEQPYYLDYEYAPLHDSERKVTGIMVTVYDVTEKVVARQHVEETKERLRLAVEATGLANFDLDLVNRTIVHSPRLPEIFGHPPETQLTHQQMYDQVLPADLEQVINKALERAKHTGIYHYEARILLPDGSTRWIKTQGKVIYNDQQVAIKIIGTLRDITEEKAFSLALEREVQERTRELAVQNEVLEKMNAELQSFAYVSSHDLQEPLRKIQIFSERIMELEQEHLSAKGKDYFARIIRSAETMQTLINDLLAYSRASNTSQSFENTSMDELLVQVKSELREAIEEKKALIDAGQLGAAFIIPFQFKQLLTNLINNSLKFSRPDEPPVITISHALAGDYHHITVTDNGIGFENKFKERIFEMFQRLNHRDEFEGTGIGLAIVKKIVDNHHGRIEASGEKGRGARFDIYLPVRNG